MRRRKNILTIILSIVCCLSACATPGQGNDSSNATPHTHELVKLSSRKPTCLKEGRLAYWYCDDCGKYFLDSAASKEITLEQTVVEKLPHTPEKKERVDSTCESAGVKEYWTCSSCTQIFADENCTIGIEQSQLAIPMKQHSLRHVAQTPAQGMQNGVKEHWTCDSCEGFFADDKGLQEIEQEDTVLYALMNVPDFLVQVPEGRDPVVLQLSDTQIIDAGQTRPNRTGVDKFFWATDQIEERCYNYITEIIQNTNPDFIIITGDVVYGEFDDSGRALTSFINFMDSFEIPWSPVFGNHDNESKKGVDWQCEQLENSQYCYFEQKTLTGNGNYSVGIAQGDELKRVFYMLDSNGCNGVSDESLANGHTVSSVGFKQDQIDWYTKQINLLKELSPTTKISFAYHIQNAIFADAYAKYGFDQSQQNQDIHIDLLKDKSEEDFGYIGKQLKGPWDENKRVYQGMKDLGADSIFVGHEHCNSASVVYDGIRFQFGQKSSEYDRFNCVDNNGTISAVFGKPATGLTPLIGGSVVVLDEEDGSIKDGYIYYCKNAGGNIDWSQFIDYEVNGLQKGSDFYGDNAVTFLSAQFDENTNAYKIFANEQGKVYINPELLRGKTTFTFSVYVQTGFNDLAGMGPFAIRLKPDDGSAANIAGCMVASGKYYIDYDVDSVAEAKIIAGTWQTFTVDISDIANTCTEFAFLVAKGNTVYLKDVAIS